jgi:hypothetical protein
MFSSRQWFLCSVALVAIAVTITIASAISLLRPSERAATHPALAQLPAHMLWAWQRPEDLRGLPSNIGVAYVATSIVIEGDVALVEPRLHPLQVSLDTALVPVVHVDASTKKPPSLNALQQKAIVDAVLRVAPQGNRAVVQLDFEVRRSQRPFLASVVEVTRQQLPPTAALSMTVLASWCAGDDWMGKLPADEIVPMAFRMAQGDATIRALLARDGQFRLPHCQHAIGTATDEAPVITISPQLGKLVNIKMRHYYFSPKPWTSLQWQSISISKIKSTTPFSAP